METGDHAIAQSSAILEWLEEVYPDPPLLPSRADDRAVVRSMVALIACDIHPLNNLRVLDYLCKSLETDEKQIRDWISEWISRGFIALEQLVRQHGRGFAFGGGPTLADCCLVPQLYSARRFGVDLTAFPALAGAGAEACALDGFAQAHPDRQMDAPA